MNFRTIIIPVLTLATIPLHGIFPNLFPSFRSRLNQRLNVGKKFLRPVSFGAFAYSANSSASTMQPSKLTYESLKKVMDEEKPANDTKPLSGRFSLRMHTLLQCKKTDTDCLTKISTAETLKNIMLNKDSQDTLAAEGLKTNRVNFDIQRHEEHETTNADITATVDATITCPKANGSCNNILYFMSKAHKDFSSCMRQEFDSESPKKRTAKCQSIFSLLGVNPVNDIQSFKLKDFSLDVTLDDEDNSSSRWF